MARALVSTRSALTAEAVGRFLGVVYGTPPA
jgi:hypothetical protein